MPTNAELLAIMKKGAGPKGEESPPSNDPHLEELKKQTALLIELRRILIGEGV